MPGYRAIGPAAGETIIGGVVSTSDYLSKGHQVDLEMLNLDGVIRRANELAPDVGKLLTWQALKAEWDKYYQANIESVPLLPYTADGELDTWLDRIADWKKTAATWAAKGNDAGFAALARNLPSSAATITRDEDNAKPSIFANPYVKLGVVGASFLGLGYLAASLAKLVRG